MKNESNWAAQVGVKYPIIQGPFGGGLSTARLAATVSNAGGLGSYGAHLLEPGQIEAICAELRSLTSRPFAINLWVSDRDAANVDEETFTRRRNDYAELYTKLNAEPPRWPGSPPALFERQVEAVLRAQPKLFSFVFGIPSREVLAACRKREILTLGAATTLEEAEALQEAGADMVLATGCEAGGHRPSFLKSAEASLVGTFALVPATRDRIRIPLVAAGGIADRRGVAAAFALGADAVQVGTAFLACAESGAAALHKARLLEAASAETVLSRGFTGRLARFLPNAFTDQFEAERRSALPYPAQSWLTEPIKRRAGELGEADHMSLYAGQAVSLVRQQNASELMQELVAGLA